MHGSIQAVLEESCPVTAAATWLALTLRWESTEQLKAAPVLSFKEGN